MHDVCFRRKNVHRYTHWFFFARTHIPTLQQREFEHAAQVLALWPPWLLKAAYSHADSEQTIVLKHQRLPITRAHFERRKRLLQQVMTDFSLPASLQAQLLSDQDKVFSRFHS
jgi:hypothetical protein